MIIIRCVEVVRKIWAHKVWLQLLRERYRLGLGCSGRRLGTSFNSTLLWKLQLPLSRLVPLLHIYTAEASTAKTTHTHWPSMVEKSITPNQWRLFENWCVYVFECVCVCLNCQTIYMHKKGTLKHLVKTKTYERPDFNMLLTLHNQG